MRICPRCLARTGEGTARCPSDGAATLPLDGEAWPVGQVLAGRFLVQGLLGRGGMGVVYRAWQLSTERPVALKVLPTAVSGDAEMVARFLRETRVTASLRSPHTVTVLDAGRLDDGTLYLAMELIGGRPLSRVLAEEGRLSPARALDVAAQICLSLEEAHARGLVHRDLKPANVMVEWIGAGREFAKVLDFGIAKVLDSADHTDVDSRVDAGPGTPAYMSPEQLKGEPVGPASDLYALGLVLFEMLAGRRPFEADSAITVMLRHLQDPPPRLAEVAPDLRGAAALDDLVQRCLAKDPAARPSSAAALRGELEALARTVPAGVSAPLPAAHPDPVAETLDSVPVVAGATAPDGGQVVAAPPTAPARRAVLELKAWGCSIQLALALGAVLLIAIPLWNRGGGLEAPNATVAPVDPVAAASRPAAKGAAPRPAEVDDVAAPASMARPSPAEDTPAVVDERAEASAAVARVAPPPADEAAKGDTRDAPVAVALADEPAPRVAARPSRTGGARRPAEVGAATAARPSPVGEDEPVGAAATAARPTPAGEDGAVAAAARPSEPAGARAEAGGRATKPAATGASTPPSAVAPRPTEAATVVARALANRAADVRRCRTTEAPLRLRVRVDVTADGRVAAPPETPACLRALFASLRVEGPAARGVVIVVDP